MTGKYDPDPGACMTLLGWVIRTAIIDYHKYLKSKNRAYYTDSAEHYLFNKNGLEGQLLRMGLSDVIEIDYIRKVARDPYSEVSLRCFWSKKEYAKHAIQGPQVY